MVNLFSGSEVVELGIQIEKNGLDFYSTLAEKSKNNKAKEKFIYLAGEEKKHIKKFEEILSSVKKYEPKVAYPEDYFSYMNALASGHVFTKKNKGEDIAKKVKTELEAVDLGIGFEKDSIVFYEGIKKIVPIEEQEIIDELILQEKDHLKQLVELKENL